MLHPTVHKNYEVANADGSKFKMCDTVNKWCDVPCCPAEHLSCGDSNSMRNSGGENYLSSPFTREI